MMLLAFLRGKAAERSVPYPEVFRPGVCCASFSQTFGMSMVGVPRRSLARRWPPMHHSGRRPAAGWLHPCRSSLLMEEVTCVLRMAPRLEVPLGEERLTFSLQVLASSSQVLVPACLWLPKKGVATACPMAPGDRAAQRVTQRAQLSRPHRPCGWWTRHELAVTPPSQSSQCSLKWHSQDGSGTPMHTHPKGTQPARASQQHLKSSSPPCPLQEIDHGGCTPCISPHGPRQGREQRWFRVSSGPPCLSFPWAQWGTSTSPLLWGLRTAG